MSSQTIIYLCIAYQLFYVIYSWIVMESRGRKIKHQRREIEALKRHVEMLQIDNVNQVNMAREALGLEPIPEKDEKHE